MGCRHWLGAPWTRGRAWWACCPACGARGIPGGLGGVPASHSRAPYGACSCVNLETRELAALTWAPRVEPEVMDS